MKTILPKFLDIELTYNTIDSIVEMVFEKFPTNRKHAHVVVLIPTLIVNEEKSYPSKYSNEYTILAEKSYRKQEWQNPYDKIARSKALQIANGNNLSGSQLETPAHLLYPEDTPYWGADKIEGIVVACSGVQPWFDKLISRMVASSIIALAKHASENN